jgi:fructokinase
MNGLVSKHTRRFTNQPATMIGLGEVLWDFLPSGKQLGGAPANFAYMTSVLGDRGLVASRIGIDELGKEIRAAIQALSLSVAYLQDDANHSTGTVNVQIDSGGQPRYKIQDHASWDFFEWTPEWAHLASRADVVCFGSLAQRSATSRATIRRFLYAAKQAIRIYDLNLRESFFTKELVFESLQLAQIAKLNADELVIVSDLLNLSGDSEGQLAISLLRKFDLELVCLTRGANGSLLVSQNESVEQIGFPVAVADAVGAGDAFTACMAHMYIRGEPLKRISEVANRLAAWVATQIGATPSIQGAALQEILDGIGPPESKL